MELKYNVTGSERKSLVGAISTALDAPTKYLGAPTFAYEVAATILTRAEHSSVPIASTWRMPSTKQALMRTVTPAIMTNRHLRERAWAPG